MGGRRGQKSYLVTLLRAQEEEIVEVLQIPAHAMPQVSNGET